MTTDEFLAEMLMGYCDTPTTYSLNKVTFHPTQDITQALGDGGEGTVVGMMRKRGWNFTFHSSGDKWFASFDKFDGELLGYPEGRAHKLIPAAAISEAARKAIEAEKPCERRAPMTPGKAGK